MILQHSQSRLGFIIWEVILFPKVIKVSIYQLKDKKSYKTLTKHIHILFNSIHVVIFQTNYQLIHDKVKHMVSFSFLLLLNICAGPFGLICLPFCVSLFRITLLVLLDLGVVILRIGMKATRMNLQHTLEEKRVHIAKNIPESK